MTKTSVGWRSKDTTILLCLVIVGLAYFSQYYDCRFNLADEGSIVLLSERLLEGERPYVDLFLGYGLLWFYPIVLLFKLTGVSFIAVRIYFLSLALTTAALAFLTVRQRTQHRGLAATVALLILLVPGTLHKAYIPLIVVSSMMCLPSFDRSVSRRQAFYAGMVAAISYHIRPDLGLIALLVLSGTLAMHIISRGSSWTLRSHQLGRLGLAFCAAILIPTLPLLLVAYSQEFLEPYLELLFQPFLFLWDFASPLVSSVIGVVQQAFFGQTAWATSVLPANPEVAKEAGQTLARIPWSAVWKGPHQKLAILTYLPLLSAVAVTMFVLVLIFYRRRNSRPIMADDTVGMLALLGLSYAAFPQFFLFRPDVAHLSQFMPGYTVLAGIFLGRCLLPSQNAKTPVSDTPILYRRFGLLMRSAMAILFTLHFALYLWLALPTPASGSIALASGQTERFQGKNGVDVAVSPSLNKFLEDVRHVVEDNTDADEVVLCFPYCPGINVMTGRRTITRRLYFDDGMLTLEPDWQLRMIEQLKVEQVPLIIIQEWAPNGTEISRFGNWATHVMKHISACYELASRLGNTRFYRRASFKELRSAQDSDLKSQREICLDLTAERTDAYLRTLDISDFVRRGSDFGSQLFDNQRIADQLGIAVEDLMNNKHFDFERLEAIEKRLEDVDRERVLLEIYEQVTVDATSNTERHIALADFLAKALHQKSLQPTYRESYLRTVTTRETSTARVEDPLVLLELGEAEPARVAAIAVDIWRAAGMEARLARLNHHPVTELFYDGGWHYLDAGAFRGTDLVRGPDDHIPSLAELSHMPLAIDRPVSYLELPSGGRVTTGSPKYPSSRYFGACLECSRTYRYKASTRRQQARDLRFGWRAGLTREEEADDIAQPQLADRFSPGSPRLADVDIGTPEGKTVEITIRWHRSEDRDGDLKGYRVFVSEESRGWSFKTEGAEPSVLPYWSHPSGWDSSMYDRMFESPKSEVALVTTEAEEILLKLGRDRTYFVTVMPFDAHGESVGRQIYRMSQELKISID